MEIKLICLFVFIYNLKHSLSKSSIYLVKKVNIQMMESLDYQVGDVEIHEKPRI